MAIVVGYAPTDEGRAALGRAAAEAASRGVRLLVVDSTRPDAPGRHDPHGAPSDLEDDVRRVRAQLVIAGDGWAPLRHDVRPPAASPDPAEDILAAAVESAAELIVIGLRRRTPVGKLLLGANAQRILLDAPCPVLAVKATP